MERGETCREMKWGKMRRGNRNWASWVAKNTVATSLVKGEFEGPWSRSQRIDKPKTIVNVAPEPPGTPKTIVNIAPKPLRNQFSQKIYF